MKRVGSGNEKEGSSIHSETEISRIKNNKKTPTTSVVFYSLLFILSLGLTNCVQVCPHFHEIHMRA